MGRWVLMAVMAAGMGSAAGCAKPVRLAPAQAPSCPPALPAATARSATPPPAPSGPAVSPDTLAALEGVGAERMAVVVLMVPGGGDPSVPKQRHEYKLSLAADADSAAVEVDGQPLGAARVQHLSPSTVARLATHAPVVPVRPTTLPRVRPPVPEAFPSRAARSRSLPAGMQPAAFLPLSNGAPIID